MTDSSWKTAFAEHTGQWAFALTISRRMVFFLRVIRDGHYFETPASTEIGSPMRTFIATNASLVSRGLIERVQRPTNVYRGVQQYGTDYKLTPAGECVCKLLELAGLLEEQKPAVTLPPVKVRRRA